LFHLKSWLLVIVTISVHVPFLQSTFPNIFNLHSWICATWCSFIGNRSSIIKNFYVT